MMIRFSTYDEASLFASKKRADGYFAEVIHQNAGHIWGAGVVHGFPVLVSEEILPEDATAPERGNERPSELALMVAMLGLCGMVIFIVFSIFLAYIMAVKAVLVFVAMPVLSKALCLAFFYGTFLCLWGMLKLTRVYRRPDHKLHWLSRLILGVLLWYFVFAH